MNLATSGEFKFCRINWQSELWAVGIISNFRLIIINDPIFLEPPSKYFFKEIFKKIVYRPSHDKCLDTCLRTYVCVK